MALASVCMGEREGEREVGGREREGEREGEGGRENRNRRLVRWVPHGASAL